MKYGIDYQFMTAYNNTFVILTRDIHHIGIWGIIKTYELKEKVHYIQILNEKKVVVPLLQ